jgi:type II secretory pathway component PulF
MRVVSVEGCFVSFGVTVVMVSYLIPTVLEVVVDICCSIPVIRGLCLNLGKLATLSECCFCIILC